MIIFVVATFIEVNYIHILITIYISYLYFVIYLCNYFPY